MAGYTFTTASQIATGLSVLASTYTTEFTALQAAFNASTGHNHDGTSGGGAKIPTAGLEDLAVTTAKLAADAVTTAKITDANVTTAKIANDAVTYAKIQNVSATDKLLGRSTSGAGDVEEITCTAAGRALLDDADASAQRTTLGLGGLAILTTVGTAQIDNDSVTYAKMQNVSATDRLLGRSSSGAGDVEEITCTAFARTILDDADAPAARTTLSTAVKTQTQEVLAGFISSPTNKTYKLVVKMPHAGTITETTTICVSGSCTATFKINTTALGGTANSVSSSEVSQAHASSNTFSAGDDIQVTITSNSSCVDMSFSVQYTRVFE